MTGTHRPVNIYVQIGSTIREIECTRTSFLFLIMPDRFLLKQLICCMVYIIYISHDFVALCLNRLNFKFSVDHCTIEFLRACIRYQQ